MAVFPGVKEFIGDYFIMINLKIKKGFFFDMDGTLIDSLPTHEQSFRHVLEKHAPELLTTFNYDNHHGVSTPDVFERLGIVDEERKNILTKAKRTEYLQSIYRDGVKVIDGADEILAFLKSLNKIIYISTSASCDSVKAVCDVTGWDQYLDGFVAAQDVKRSKPDPQIFQLTSQRSGVGPQDALVLEDAFSGQQASLAAGIDCVMVNQPEDNHQKFIYKNLRDFYLRLKEDLSGS